MSNNYDQIAGDYIKTSTKPDKQYSILPTVLTLAGDLKDKIVVDLGCGDGFFTRELYSKSPKHIVGIDNSEEQLKLAKEKGPAEIEYKLSDIFNDPLPVSDMAVAPFLLNYAASTEALGGLFKRIFQSLNMGGVLIGIIDLPQGLDLRRFGAHKRLLGSATDGTAMEIDLYNRKDFICTLQATYFTKATVESLLIKAGFQSVRWRVPIVSQEGIEAFGAGFWRGYTEQCELGYFTAHKQEYD